MKTGAAQRPGVRTATPLLILVLGLALGGVIHLLRPNLAAHYAPQVSLGPLQYAHNVDSSGFARTVIRFPVGLTEGHGRIRLNRPLYTTLSWLTFQPLRLLRGVVPSRVSARVADGLRGARDEAMWVGIDPTDVVLAWGAMLLVSNAIYLLSLWLIYRALSVLFPPRLALALALVPALHFDTIDYVLVPHSEPFNLLVPALFLGALVRWCSEPRAATLPEAAAFGVAMLGKPLAWPGLNWLLEARRDRSIRAAVPLAVAVAALMLLPTLLYLTLLWAFSVEPYHHEAQGMRQVVWVVDYVREGNWLGLAGRWSLGMWAHLKHTLVGFAGPLGVTLLLVMRAPSTAGRLVSLSRCVWGHLLIYSATAWIFWCLVGFHWPRIAVVQFPPVVVLLGAVAAARPYGLHWVVVALSVSVLLRLIGAYSYA